MLSGKIFVCGHNGLVGSALCRCLKKQGHDHRDIITRSQKSLDLTDQRAVNDFFRIEQPAYVFLAAAKVGGIVANSKYPAEFVYSNMQVQMNVIDACYRHGVKKLMFLGSSCIYPRECPQPMKEEYLLSGKLEPTNEAYAIAKIAGIVMCQSYNKQYGTNFISVMPTNLYGLNDFYHPENSHVLPAMIRKFHEAKERHEPKVILWGTGMPTREFLYSDDLAEACVFLMDRHDGSEIVNIGSGVETSILELAFIVAETVGYTGEFEFDKTHPDGTPRKVLDCSRIHSMGWRHKTSLEDGIKLTYEDFLKGGYRGKS